MSKVQEYLKNKRIQEMKLPKLYIVKSTREGVEKPIERQVVEIIENVSFRGNERTPIDRYKLEGCYPDEVDILRGETSSKDDGYASGDGDLWCWCYFSSFSSEEAEKYYQQELERIKNKYNKNMKEQILKIADQLKYDDITSDHAQNLLLDLFGVSGGWVYVNEKKPPDHIELLAKSPEGTIYLVNWSIFTCQCKGEDSDNWQWKLI
jgi:hypothetical protein